MACLFNFSLKIILKSNQTFERPVKYAVSGSFSVNSFDKCVQVNDLMIKWFNDSAHIKADKNYSKMKELYWSVNYKIGIKYLLLFGEKTFFSASLKLYIQFYFAPDCRFLVQFNSKSITIN